jgi:hypothetical protein
VLVAGKAGNQHLKIEILGGIATPNLSTPNGV